MVFSETLSRDFKLKSKDTAPLLSILLNRAGHWQPSRGEAGLLHRCEQREPEQQGRDGSHSYPSLPTQRVSHSAAVFSGINIPETPEHQWQAQCLSKETIPPCREILIWLTYSSLIQFYLKNAIANVKQVLTFNTTLLKYSEGFLFLLHWLFQLMGFCILPCNTSKF